MYSNLSQTFEAYYEVCIRKDVQSQITLVVSIVVLEK